MKKYSLLTFLVALVASIPAVVSASSPVKYVAACGQSVADNFFGFQPWYACLPKNNQGDYVITSLNDVLLIIFPVVEWLVKAGALVAAGIIFFMFIQMILARGDAGKIATAVSGIRDAVIGFIICLISVAIINFVAGAFQAS